MTYQAVGIYTLNGDFLGYGINQEGIAKLLNNNLWQETPKDIKDLREQLARLNDAIDIRAYWPDVRDPEVQALTEDPEWEPLKLSPVEVVDEANSLFIWDEEPTDETPGLLDTDASVIVYKYEQAPAPTDVQARIKKACEIVARKRANV